MNNQPAATFVTLTPRRPLAQAVRLVLTTLCALTALTLPASAGTITTVAGGGGIPSPFTSGIPATNAQLPGLYGLATDLLGRVYLAHYSGATVHRLNPTNGLLTTVAGSGTFGFSGDGGPAVAAGLSTPSSVAVDLTGNIYICDNADSRVRKIDVATGIIQTVVGTDVIGYDVDDIPAINASLSFPMGIAVDVHGNLYIADTSAGLVRKVDAATGFIHRLAGEFLHHGHTGDGGPAVNARINSPLRIAVDASDNVYFIDQGNRVYVRRIDGVTGIITTIAGGGDGDGSSGSATNASLEISTNSFTAIVEDLAVDNLGSLYIGGWSQVWKVDLASGNISIVAGVGGATVGFSGDGGPATDALLNVVLGLAVSSNGDLYLTDGGNGRVRKITAERGRFSVNWFKVAGGGGSGTNNTYKLTGTVGQPDAIGRRTNSQFSVVGGFWALPVVVQATGAPTLTIVPAALGQATISWTPNTPGFVLQESLNLAPPNWTNSVSGATNPITVPAVLPAKFYRLNKP